ncbi:FEN1 [Symbiodinium natans]|uniref:FEN1 protein n=1 Tax=Symbiodinium natans TaxID=878477 RepID=A0A812KN37_9DINO|nr:FEN1 [Symbiodinium natans]
MRFEEAHKGSFQQEVGPLHDNVDEWEMEATLPALAVQLRHGETPGRSSLAKKKTAAAPETSWQLEEAEVCVPVPPVSPAAQASPSGQMSAASEELLHLPLSHEAGSSKAGDDNSPLSEPIVQAVSKAEPFPSDVEVSTSTQLMLLTWARWGRNAWRIKQEDQIKQMQHRRFPRTPAPPREPLSPQPTPRERLTETPGSTPSGSPASRPRTGAAAWRAGGELGMGTTVHSREGRSEGRDERNDRFAFAELREEQRDSMAQQGARTKLVRALGGNAATAHSTGTPGFGVDTPGFPASGAASADASVASSGVASPVKGGQMSPWILEAEALCEESEEDASPGGGWSLDPGPDNLLVIEEELHGQQKKVEPAAQANEDQEVLDEDELERVEMFEESPSKKSTQAQA